MAEIREALQRGLRAGILDRAPHAVVLYDLDRVEQGIAALQAAFPADTLHALAIKACPLSRLVLFAAERGCGAEVASEAELQQALRLGIAAEQIVFDSPAKTMEELQLALSSGVYVNADSLQELDRIAQLTKGLDRVPALGVRVNPGLGAGAIEATSTAMPGSKFGVSLADDEAELLDRFEAYPWLTGLHVHAGSQGCDLELLADCVAAVVEFATKVEGRVGVGRITTFDLGGGLGTAYRFSESKPGLASYVSLLRARAPRLFSGEWRLVTEFGRAVWAEAGFAVSRVEYTKISHGRRIAVVHLGADMFPRTAYVPDVWYHEISIFDSEGRPKTGSEVEQDIAGPLCFSGDLLARRRRLPAIEPGDHVLVHHAGAYTLGMWSRYNSRLSPPVYGFTADSEDLVLLRTGESTAQVLGFWD